jgi:hypothetical protein
VRRRERSCLATAGGVPKHPAAVDCCGEQPTAVGVERERRLSVQLVRGVSQWSCLTGSWWHPTDEAQSSPREGDPGVEVCVRPSALPPTGHNTPSQGAQRCKSCESETLRFSTARQKMVLERRTHPKRLRRTCTCVYALQSWRGESAGVAKRPRELISHPKPPYLPSRSATLFHRCLPLRPPLALLSSPPQPACELPSPPSEGSLTCALARSPCTWKKRCSRSRRGTSPAPSATPHGRFTSAASLSQPLHAHSHVRFATWFGV